MFKEELDYFIANQEALLKQHQGKVLAIKHQQVLGAYDNPLEAFSETVKQHPAGTFMIQPCAPGPDAYTVTITSLNLNA